LTGLSCGTTYYYRVESILDNLTAVSAEYTFTTLSAPTLTTKLSASVITLGGIVTDTATVSGYGPGPTPQGIVLFAVSTNNGASWIYFSLRILKGGSATSDACRPAAAGSYLFRAVYIGDTSYSGSVSANEPLTVNKANSTTTTYLSASVFTLGGSVTDTAMVSGPGQIPTGLVSFQVSTDGGTKWTYFGDAKTLRGGWTTSDAYRPLARGSYLFRAVYSGDNNYNASQSANNAEPLKVH
jgi:hypothetical protein